VFDWKDKISYALMGPTQMHIHKYITYSGELRILLSEGGWM